MVKAEPVVGAGRLCAPEAAAVLGGRNPKALTGGEDRVSFPPIRAVTVPAEAAEPQIAAPDFASPLPLSLGLDPVVVAFGGFAGRFPPAGWFAFAGRTWCASTKGAVTPAPSAPVLAVAFPVPGGQTRLAVGGPVGPAPFPTALVSISLVCGRFAGKFAPVTLFAAVGTTPPPLHVALVLADVSGK